MKNTLLLLTLFFVLNLNAQTPKVLIIGIDGVRSDALAVANTPNIDALIANGTYSYDALNDDITISGPGWSSMLTGVWSPKHGVTDNSFVGSNYGAYPHFFQHIEHSNSSLTTASICHWSPINDQIVQTIADYKLNVNSDSDVAVQAATYLLNNDPDVLFLHFDDCDGAGHSSGFSPTNPSYISTIETTDIYIGMVLTALSNRSNYANENWLILSSTDHGGNGTSHGGNSIEEERVFFIASGNSIPNQEIDRDSTVTPLAANCIGATNELFFDGNGAYAELSNAPIFDFNANQDFTIECRVRTTQAADVAIIGNKDWDSGVNNGFVFSFKFAAGPEWKVNIGDGSFRADLNSVGSISDNAWHTLSVTFDRDGDMTMYEDGNLIGATPISFIGDIDSGYPIRIGADALADYAFTGSVGEVRVWNSVLDATTINNWACNSVDHTHPDYVDLLGYWKIDEGTGTQLIDHSVYSNDGVINNATWMSSPTETVVYDYSNTPRITDIAVTALAHLCIPIDPLWDLDGFPMFSDCPVFQAACTENDFILPSVHQPVYHANQTISSNATIDGVDVEYKAGDCIELIETFEVLLGTMFSAEIESCN